MTEKIVYQTDHIGVYTGTAVADESPLEPGVFLLPAGCVEVAPPTIGPYQRGRWDSVKWIVETAKGDPVDTTVTPKETPVAAKEYVSAIQQYMDSAAQASGYDSMQTAVTYAEEPVVPKFQLEGLAFRAWRSLVWDYAYEQLAQVEAGLKEQPTIEDVILALPKLVLPAPEPTQ